MSSDGLPRGWNQRPDISERLVEEGWEPDPDYRDMIWTKGDCVFTLVDRFGRGELRNRREGYSIQFNVKVPVPVILSACEQATARCQEHGTACEPDDHVEPTTVCGEVV